MVIVRSVKKVPHMTVNAAGELHEACPGDHECLDLKQFAARVRRSRQTVYKWAQYRKDKFPPGSLLKDPTGHYMVDWDVYKHAIVIVN
jgi:hypothetical protein